MTWEELNLTEYLDYINQIIAARGQWSEEIKNCEYGCSRHHIKLKCKGGLPCKSEGLNWEHHENIIWLTHYEHAIAHYILAKNNLSDYKVCSAFTYMQKFNEKHKIDLDFINPNDYNKIYSAAQARNGCNNGMFGRNHSEKSRLLMSQNMHPHILTEEERKKRSYIAKNSRWYNNGVCETFSLTCPEGWWPGRKPGTNSGDKNAAAIKCAVYDSDKNYIATYGCINTAGKVFGLKNREAKKHTGWERGPYKGFYFIKIENKEIS